MKKLVYFSLFLQAFCLNTSLFADNADNAPSRDQGLMQILSMIGIFLLFFYFILWRPEQKRRKSLEAQRNSLKKGDRVTAMGIIGTIFRIEENTVILKMVDGSKIEFLKAAISDVIASGDEDLKKAEKEDSDLSKKVDLREFEK